MARHVKRKGAPAAAQFEHVLAVFQAGAPASEVEQSGPRIECRHEKRHRQKDAQQSLELEEEKELERQVAAPLAAQLHVASLFAMADDAREEKKDPEPQAPERRHRRDQQRAHRVAACRCGVDRAEQSQAARPSSLHDGGIPKGQVDQPQYQH